MRWMTGRGRCGGPWEWADSDNEDSDSDDGGAKVADADKQGESRGGARHPGPLSSHCSFIVYPCTLAAASSAAACSAASVPSD